MNDSYLFRSERLGFRDWSIEDIEIMSQINADPAVMEFFPGIRSRNQTIAFIVRMQKLLQERGFCYFAVDKLENGAFIGFIGLSEQTFEADFTPCFDIGWRLDKKEWNKGFATEGARKCLEYGFDKLGLKKVVSIAPKVNLRSEWVMQKIGMTKVMDFKHPLLSTDKRLEECVLYEIIK